MKKNFLSMPGTTIDIDPATITGPCEAWRHSIGHGGVNSEPWSERVIHGISNLRPRLVRVFLQEYFSVYPAPGCYDWKKLDRFLGSVARTGAKVLATINFKPPTLFPVIDQNIWRPNRIDEWQELMYQLARRYSAEQNIVTYWESVNEPDIGENGGCPFRIPDVAEIHEFYQLTTQPIIAACTDLKVGGPCPADYHVVMPFIDLCIREKTRLDFVSYHLYEDDPAIHHSVADQIAAKVQQIPGTPPEIMINEWNKNFDHVAEPVPGVFDLISVEEMAMQPRRAAHAAAILLAMMETGLDWSFYFLAADGCLSNEAFKSFFSPQGLKNIMYIHWNEAPHRFGLFGEDGQVRPQYFVYQILSRLRAMRVKAVSPEPDLRILATCSQQEIAVMVVNFNLHESIDRRIRIHFENLLTGMKRITAYRIDEDQRWNAENVELEAIETRRVDVQEEFTYQFYCPADSVLLVTLRDCLPEEQPGEAK